MVPNSEEQILDTAERERTAQAAVARHATPLLASPWNVIGQGLPPSAGLSAARSVIYLGGVNLTGPLAVLATYAAAGTLLVLASAAWRHRRPAPAPAQVQPA